MDPVGNSNTNRSFDRHGGPYDRGSADSFYQRGSNPHYWPEGTYNGTQVREADMTPEEIAAYHEGFADNEKAGLHKIY